LVAETGDELNLNQKSHILTNVEGLGHENTNTFALASATFLLAHTEPAQGKLVGDILFMDLENAETDYQEVVDFIEKASTLKIRYVISQALIFYADVALEYIQKGEIDYSVMALVVPIGLNLLSPWYKSYRRHFLFGETESDGFLYPALYPVLYSAKSISGATEITVNGHYDAGFVVECDGLMTNPAVTLTDVETGEILGRMQALGVTIAVEEQLVFDTRDATPGVYKIDSSGTVTDLSNTLELSNRNFFSIPKNRLCRMSVSSSTSTPDGTVTVYEYYKSV